MDARIINAFAGSAVTVLKTMAFTDSVAGAPYLKKDDTARGDVSGMISFDGSVKGSMAVSFSGSCILKIVSTMLGEELCTINREIEDAVGELTNMISGDARRRLEREQLIVSASIPMILSGNDHVIKHDLGTPSIVIPFSTSDGSFVVDICIKDNKEV